MCEGFEVDVLALRQAADGIGRTVEAVRTRPLDASSRPDLGHDRLAGATEELLARWQRGVENLVADGRAVTSALTAAAQAYERDDLGGARALDGIVRSETVPDPGPR